MKHIMYRNQDYYGDNTESSVLQNKDLVTKIAEDMYITQEDKDTFINKYLKKNFFVL